MFSLDLYTHDRCLLYKLTGIEPSRATPRKEKEFRRNTSAISEPFFVSAGRIACFWKGNGILVAGPGCRAFQRDVSLNAARDACK